MSPVLQQYVALAIVAMAATALAYRMLKPWLRSKSDSGCAAGCGHCPANKDGISRTTTGQTLVQLQLPMNKRGPD